MKYESDIGTIEVVDGVAKLGDVVINFDSALYHIGYHLGIIDVSESGDVGLSRVYGLVSGEVGRA